MSRLRRYHVVDDYTGETISTVELTDEAIEPFNEVANTLGFYLADREQDEQV
jgi:uncharacterized protein YhfF